MSHSELMNSMVALSQVTATVKPVLRDHCRERPPVLKDHIQ